MKVILNAVGSTAFGKPDTAQAVKCEVLQCSSKYGWKTLSVASASGLILEVNMFFWRFDKLSDS
jgi:hypothetical protein